MKKKKKLGKSIDLEELKGIIVDVIQFIGSIASIVSIILYFVEKMQR